jgi:hypothetical protein
MRSAPSAQYITIAIMAAVVVAIAWATLDHFSSSRWLQDPVSGAMRIEYVDKIQFAQKDKPQLIVMGSSRPAFGIRAADLASAFGMMPAQAKNIAFPSFGGSSILTQIQMRYADITGAKIWVIGVDDYYALAPLPMPSEIKPLADRTDDTIRNWLQPAIEINRKGRQLLTNVRSKTGWGPVYSFNIWKMSKHGSWTDSRLTGRVVDEVADAHMFTETTRDYFSAKQYSPSLAAPFDELLKIGEQHHIKMILVDMPSHSHYKAIVREKYSLLVTQNRDEFRRLARSHGAIFITCADDPTNCGVPDSGFGDPVHLNANGAKHFTEFLARRMVNYLEK